MWGRFLGLIAISHRRVRPVLSEFADGEPGLPVPHVKLIAREAITVFPFSAISAISAVNEKCRSERAGRASKAKNGLKLCLELF